MTHEEMMPYREKAGQEEEWFQEQFAKRPEELT